MSIELYTTFFGFSERPFTLLPDPDFMFWSPSHKRAYAILEYGLVTHAPLTVITGEVGAGKTTLVQHLLTTLDEDTRVGLISNAQGGRGDLLRWVLYSLGIDAPENSDYISLFKIFQDFTIDTYAKGQHTVLVIDEAQNLSMETLEELRMFTNINAHKDELLQLILVGQPELRDMISAPKLRQFAQRVTAAYHLDGLTEQSTTDYIRYRLRHVGGTGEEISDFACKTIYMESQGVPRLINKLCDMALVYAASAESPIVDADLIKELLNDNPFIKPGLPPAQDEQDIFMLENPIGFHQSNTSK